MKTSVKIVSGITGEHLELSPIELAGFLSIPETDWISSVEAQERLPSTDLSALVSRGLLERQTEQHRSAAAAAAHWDPIALGYYRYMAGASSDRADPASSREDDSVIDYRERLAHSHDDAAQFVEKHGPPPPPFFRAEGTEQVADLVLAQTAWKDTPLGELLLRRRSNRILDRSTALRQEDLATVLEATLRPHSKVEIGDVTFLRKSSPSGGSLHPIEAFVSTPGVAGLPSGIFHYRCDRHALALLKEESSDHLRAMNGAFAKGQAFISDANAVIIFAARFDRHNWKYRDRPQALSVVYTDLGHISQTAYLIATQLGLGCYYTAFIDYHLLSEELDLDNVSVGPVGLFALGPPAVDSTIQEIQPSPIGE